MDGKKRIARLRNKEFAWAKDVLGKFKARDGPNPELVAKLKTSSDKKPSKPITGVFASAAAFGAALEKRGFRRLGSGAYSTVYGKDGYDRVIKVSRCLDNWIDYVAWASKAGYAGTFAPKVYSWKRFFTGKERKTHPLFGYSRWDETEWSVAIVERMKETLNADSQLARDFRIIERIHDLAARSVLAELVMEEIIPGVGKFFKDLHKNFYASDVYGKNLMIRSDGTFCVTDPVCGTITTEAIRFRAGDFTPPLMYTRRYFESCYRH